MYSAEAIKHLTKLIQSDDAPSRLWLQKNNFPELILLHYAIDGNEDAFHKLKEKKHAVLTAFSLAVLDDKRAYNWLVENKHFIWAATAKATYKDKQAEGWLLRNKLGHYAELAKAIRTNEESLQADDIPGLLKKFIGIFKKK